MGQTGASPRYSTSHGYTYEPSQRPQGYSQPQASSPEYRKSNTQGPSARTFRSADQDSTAYNNYDPRDDRRGYCEEPLYFDSATRVPRDERRRSFRADREARSPPCYDREEYSHPCGDAGRGSLYEEDQARMRTAKTYIVETKTEHRRSQRRRPAAEQEGESSRRYRQPYEDRSSDCGDNSPRDKYRDSERQPYHEGKNKARHNGIGRAERPPLRPYSATQQLSLIGRWFDKGAAADRRKIDDYLKLLSLQADKSDPDAMLKILASERTCALKIYTTWRFIHRLEPMKEWTKAAESSLQAWTDITKVTQQPFLVVFGGDGVQPTDSDYLWGYTVFAVKKAKELSNVPNVVTLKWFCGYVGDGQNATSMVRALLGQLFHAGHIPAPKMPPDDNFDTLLELLEAAILTQLMTSPVVCIIDSLQLYSGNLSQCKDVVKALAGCTKTGKYPLRSIITATSSLEVLDDPSLGTNYDLDCDGDPESKLRGRLRNHERQPAVKITVPNHVMEEDRTRNGRPTRQVPG